MHINLFIHINIPLKLLKESARWAGMVSLFAGRRPRVVEIGEAERHAVVADVEFRLVRDDLRMV